MYSKCLQVAGSQQFEYHPYAMILYIGALRPFSTYLTFYLLKYAIWLGFSEPNLILFLVANNLETTGSLMLEGQSSFS